MAPPVIGSFAQLLYDRLQQYTGSEAQLDYPLMVYAGAIGSMLNDLNDIVREGANDEPGWSLIMDADHTPEQYLHWLGQFVGVDLPAEATGADARAFIKNAAGFKRGTVASLKAAVAMYLTGNKTVFVRERDGGPYLLTVVTYTIETPNSAEVLAMLTKQKPAGIILTYNVIAAQDYALLLANHPLYSNVFADYATYDGIFQDRPGV